MSGLTVHFGMVRAGSLTAPAKTRLAVDDLRPSAAFVMPVEPPTLQPPGAGLLALANIPIGLPLFRSAILAQIHAVAGVAAVRALRFNGTEAPFGIAAGEGKYHDFSSGLTVGNTAAGDALFAPAS